jgi:tetratricopeptide (TPR) repeat protein
MSKTTPISNCLLLAFILTPSLLCLEARATKLSAPPLPHESDAQAPPQQVVPQVSRFYKGNDYRDEERRKDAADAKAAQQAEVDRKHALDAGVTAAKQRLKDSIDANNRAVQLGKLNRWSEAIQEHERAVQLDPSNKQFRINLSAARTAYGEQRLAQRDFTSAAHLFRQAMAIAPDNGLASKRLVETIRKMGLDPSSVDTRLGLGDQLAAAGDLPAAGIEYQAALQLEESPRTYVKMGDLYYRYGQLDGASAWYRQAIAKNPDFGPAHRQLGFIALAQKDPTSAAASLRKAVIADPKDAAAGASLVELWRKQVAANPTVSENHLGLAGALQLTGDFPGADSEYRKVQANDPRNPNIAAGLESLTRAYKHAQAERHRLAAETLYSQSLRKEALAEISQAVMAEPRNAYYQFLLGECLEANGDYQGAHQAYLTCVLIDPENNKEAAARMKQMQNSGSAGSANQNNPGSGQTPYSVPLGSRASVSPANSMANTNLRNSDNPNYTPQTPSKDVFEGGNGIQSAGGSQLSFRTHNESGPAESPGQNTVDASDSRVLAQVNQAEAQRDYQAAANLIRQILPANLQNAELHHRLAVNLMSAGEISEAISEFRIASALTPARKNYSDDLAQALAIHKRSLMSSANNDQKNQQPATEETKK